MATKSFLKVLLITLAPLLAMNTSYAHWSLDNEASNLSFVTVKADNVAEVHSFDSLSGSIDDEGAVKISIELASVNTMIQIRNERMQAMLFETAMFPNADISATINMAALTAMAPGASVTRQVEFTISLHGSSNSYMADVMIVRLEHGAVATTMKPIVVMADSFGLTAGVEQLREVAGLSRISNAVPVSFSVVFSEGH